MAVGKKTIVLTKSIVNVLCKYTEGRAVWTGGLVNKNMMGQKPGRTVAEMLAGVWGGVAG